MNGLVKTEWNKPVAWFTVLLFALFSVQAEADVAAGIAAYKGGDFVVALREFQEAAKHDDVHALNYLGIMYAEGLGTPRDDKRAADMFYIAEVLGYPEAMANLARMYAEGRGVPQDNKGAVSLYRAAAKAGFKPAIIRMAEIYEKGELGEVPNAALAREWRARLRGRKTQTWESSRRKQAAPVQIAIKAVAVTQRRGQILIRVSTTAPLSRPPTSFNVANPPRIVIDFPNTVNGVGRLEQDGGNSGLRAIKLVQVRDRTRMILTLHKAMRHAVKVHGGDLLITLRSGAHTSN
jgi:AMIN domain/Sel1 repeat